MTPERLAEIREMFKWEGPTAIIEELAQEIERMRQAAEDAYYDMCERDAKYNNDYD